MSEREEGTGPMGWRGVSHAGRRHTGRGEKKGEGGEGVGSREGTRGQITGG